jgi:molecular chaperone DnaJ
MHALAAHAHERSGRIDGKVSLTIPDGSQSGKTFRLRGKGVKSVRSSYPGDLYCHVIVETPVRLTEKQKKLLREFDASLKEGGAKHSPQSKALYSYCTSCGT